MQETTRGGSGSGFGTGRITDFFQPKGGRRPVVPPMQTPLDGLLGAAKPRPSIANFFQPAPVGAGAAGREGMAGASGRAAASAPAGGPNASSTRGEVTGCAGTVIIAVCGAERDSCG